MPQFLVGFWCGCAAATLVLYLMFANRLRQVKEQQRKNGEKKKTPEFSNTEEKQRGPGPCVLLIDDSKLSRTVIKEILLKKDLNIHEAGCGFDGIKLAKKYNYDLIFIDQHMPVMDGDETLRYLWSEAGVGRDVPVVAMGSAVRKENEELFREKGYVTCLGKPIQRNRLEEIVSQWIPNEKKTDVPEGFSYEAGLANFDGNEEAYRETLVLFAQLWEERREQLKQFLEEENMQEYAILIHAIKGDARTLGALDLGELAYAQEMKAKAGDTETIRTTFESVRTAGDKTAEYFIRNFS